MFKVNADAYARLIEFLTERPRTYRALAELTGLHYTTVREHVNALHRRGVVHVAGWAPDGPGRFRIPCFYFGQLPDAPKPTMDSATRQQVYRNRQRQAAGLPTKPLNLPKRMPPNSVFALGACP